MFVPSSGCGQEAKRTMSEDDHDINNRRDARDSVFLSANVRSTRRENVGVVRVRNISSSGMMAEGPPLFDTGDALEVELRNIGTIHGHVVWASNGRFGMIFDRAIDPKLARKPVSTAVDTTPKPHRPLVPPFSDCGRLFPI